MASAREVVPGSAVLSTIRTLAPSLVSHRARTSPVGPAPTTRTSQAFISGSSTPAQRNQSPAQQNQSEAQQNQRPHATKTKPIATKSKRGFSAFPSADRGFSMGYTRRARRLLCRRRRRPGRGRRSSSMIPTFLIFTSKIALPMGTSTNRVDRDCAPLGLMPGQPTAYLTSNATTMKAMMTSAQLPIRT